MQLVSRLYATAADIGVAAALNLIFIYKYTGYILDFKVLFRNTIIAAIMGIFMYFLYDMSMSVTSSLFLRLLTTTVCGSALYIGLMVLTKGLTRTDAQSLPFFGKYFYN